LILNILSVVFVVAGIFLLVVSLRPTGTLKGQLKHQSSGWKILYFLIIFFIAGYGLFIFTLVDSVITPPVLIVAVILFGGGAFVAIVTRMSINSIENEQRIAALERHRALHDELTNLPNRTLLHERIDQAIKFSDRDSQPLTILLMDLDRFKEINDTLGHHYGDVLLQLVAPRLRDSVRSSDTVARLGGDEFAVVLPGAGVDQAIGISDKIFNAIDKEFRVENHKISVGISIGIAIYPEHGKSSNELLQRADVAMYNAKRNDLHYSIYDSKYDQYSANRLKRIAQLREAVENNKLFIKYQPIVSVESGRTIGLEALVHWQADEDTVVYTEELTSLAENTGLMHPITQWAIENVLAQKAAWEKQQFNYPVSINISVKSLQVKNFPEQILEIVNKHQINPKDISFEITESNVMSDKVRTFDGITKLKNMGFGISLVNFGTGYSSLSFLKQLPVKELKIDKSFVMDMFEDENDAIIIRSTIDLAHNMGREIIAEGVSKEEVYDLLEILGCDAVQGSYVSEPLVAVEIVEWLAQNQVADISKVRRNQQH